MSRHDKSQAANPQSSRAVAMLPAVITHHVITRAGATLLGKAPFATWPSPFQRRARHCACSGRLEHCQQPSHRIMVRRRLWGFKRLTSSPPCSTVRASQCARGPADGDRPYPCSMYALAFRGGTVYLRVSLNVLGHNFMQTLYYNLHHVVCTDYTPSLDNRCNIYSI